MTPAQITEETILQRYESLPQDLKDAMIGIGTADVIYDIGKKAGLNIEQIGDLAEEIGMIILGLTPSGDFIPDMKKRLTVDEEKAASLARDVNDKVFLKIRESLKRMHGASFGDGMTRESISAKPITPPPSLAPVGASKPYTPAGSGTLPTPPVSPAPAKPLGVAQGKPPAPPTPTTPVQKAPTPPPPPRKEPLIIKPMGAERKLETPPASGASLPTKPFDVAQGKPYTPLAPGTPPTTPAIEKVMTPPLPETKTGMPTPSYAPMGSGTPYTPAGQSKPPVSPMSEPPARLPVMEEKIENVPKPPAPITPKPLPPPPPPQNARVDPYREPVE